MLPCSWNMYSLQGNIETVRRPFIVMLKQFLADSALFAARSRSSFIIKFYSKVLCQFLANLMSAASILSSDRNNNLIYMSYRTTLSFWQIKSAVFLLLIRVDYTSLSRQFLQAFLNLTNNFCIFCTLWKFMKQLPQNMPATELKTPYTPVDG